MKKKGKMPKKIYHCKLSSSTNMFSMKLKKWKKLEKLMAKT